MQLCSHPKGDLWRPCTWSQDTHLGDCVQAPESSCCEAKGFPFSLPGLPSVLKRLTQELMIKGVPAVAQQKQIRLVSMRMWVQSLASLSGVEDLALL